MAQVHELIAQGDAPGALTTLLQAAQLLGGTDGGCAAAEHFRAAFLQRASTEDVSDLVTQLETISLSRDGASLQDQQPAPAAAARVAPEAMPWDRSHLGLPASGAELQQAHAQSYVCEACGGVVAIHRRAQHQAQWCPAIGNPAGT
jgi:hypothetical protein